MVEQQRIISMQNEARTRVLQEHQKQADIELEKRLARLKDLERQQQRREFQVRCGDVPRSCRCHSLMMRLAC